MDAWLSPPVRKTPRNPRSVPQTGAPRRRSEGFRGPRAPSQRDSLAAATLRG